MPSQVAEQLNLNKLTGHKWFIHAACASTGEGIYEGMNQLATMVREFKKERRYWNYSAQSYRWGDHIRFSWLFMKVYVLDTN